MEGTYTFPTHRLNAVQGSSDKTPLVLVACGSYSPITFLHLRMFEMARDDAHYNTEFEVVGGYLSPVNDAYAKLGLASAGHRVNMCTAAVNETSDWLMLDPWEARQPGYTPTAQVLDHFDHELNTVRGGADVVVTDAETGETRIEKRRIRIMLLAGSDLILTMSEPGVWAEKDLHHILGIYGCYIIERAESELDQTIFSSSSVHSRSPLALYRHQIHMVDQLVRNDVSSTKVRLFIRKGMSVKYLIPSVAIRYIERHNLYRTADRRPNQVGERISLSPDVEVLEREREKDRRQDRVRRAIDTSTSDNNPSQPSPSAVASSSSSIIATNRIPEPVNEQDDSTMSNP